MTPRELVYCTLDFSRPDRVPRQLWTLPWAEAHFPGAIARIRRDFPDDIIGCPGFHAVKPHIAGDPTGGGNFTDEWGCVFEGIQAGYIGEVKHPVIATWEDLPRLRPPQESLTIDKKQINAFCAATDRFVMAGCCPRPFERLQFLRGSANIYLDLMEMRSEFRQLLQRVHRFYLDELELWLDTAVDGISFMDDWGSQRALLINPSLWRNVFKPLYAEYISMAHAKGKRVFMHSDGYIFDVIGDFVELGLDALNSQVFCMGVGKLAGQFRGKLTFWGEIDRQHILPYGSVEDVRAAVNDFHTGLYDGGGVIAQCEFGPGALAENVYEVFRAWADMPC